VAGAPVADWRDYDTAYSERYLGMPGDDEAKWDAASLLPRAAAKATPGRPARPLLIIHGTADDNVYFFHSLKLADALERAGRPFELLPLAGVTHMPLDPDKNEALYVRLGDFLREHI
jgi:dipeptidyl-peptidase-4